MRPTLRDRMRLPRRTVSSAGVQGTSARQSSTQGAEIVVIAGHLPWKCGGQGRGRPVEARDAQHLVRLDLPGPRIDGEETPGKEGLLHAGEVFDDLDDRDPGEQVEEGVEASEPRRRPPG